MGPGGEMVIVLLIVVGGIVRLGRSVRMGPGGEVVRRSNSL